jgi:hypothetical protein
MPQPEKVHVFGNKLLSMLCPTCSICWTHILCRFLLVPCWGLDLLQFYAILSFYFLYSSATENQLHMSRGMVPCQVLRVTPLLFLVHCWARFIISSFHLSSQSISQGATISIWFQCAHVMNHLWEILSVT